MYRSEVYRVVGYVMEHTVCYWLVKHVSLVGGTCLVVSKLNPTINSSRWYYIIALMKLTDSLYRLRNVV